MTKRTSLLVFLILAILLAGCSPTGAGDLDRAQPAVARSTVAAVRAASPAAATPGPEYSLSATPTLAPTGALASAQTPTATPFAIGRELTLDYLRSLEILPSAITFEQELESRVAYRQHLVSYISESNKVYGLLTIPRQEPPPEGFKAIVFNHGYIPPAEYRTTERYVAYVDYLARSGFVVFKIDLRGHGASEGVASGSYFAPGYTIDAISAFKSLQQLDFVDPQGIGMWGHSMAGNLVLRAMLVEPGIQAGVIWAGAVYSYEDFAQYGIQDNTFRPVATAQNQETPSPRRRSQEIFEAYGQPGSQSPYWQAVSLTANIGLLQNPLQLHHAQDDSVVTINYSFGLAAVLQESGKPYEFFTYEGGGHNLISPYFELAMQRTVEFFRLHL